MGENKKYNLQSLKETVNVYFNPKKDNLDEIKIIIETDKKFTLPNEDDPYDNYSNIYK